MQIVAARQRQGAVPWHMDARKFAIDWFEGDLGQNPKNGMVRQKSTKKITLGNAESTTRHSAMLEGAQGGLLNRIQHLFKRLLALQSQLFLLISQARPN